MMILLLLIIFACEQSDFINMEFHFMLKVLASSILSPMTVLIKQGVLWPYAEACGACRSTAIGREGELYQCWSRDRQPQVQALSKEHKGSSSMQNWFSSPRAILSGRAWIDITDVSADEIFTHAEIFKE